MIVAQNLLSLFLLEQTQTAIDLMKVPGVSRKPRDGNQ